MIERLDNDLLEAFTEGFFGYGNYEGKFWFVGIEEAGGESFEEMNSRITTWDRRGRREIEDVWEYHTDIGITENFDEKIKIQRTWSGLIKFIYGLNGKQPTYEEIREYQRNMLGRAGGETCLIELLPLANQSTRHWNYDKWSDLLWLRNRSAYSKKILEYRRWKIKENILIYKPKIVIFYSMNSGIRRHWELISRTDLFEWKTNRYMTGRSNDTLFAIVLHPAAWGIKTGYFTKVGMEIGKMISTKNQKKKTERKSLILSRKGTERKTNSKSTK